MAFLILGAWRDPRVRGMGCEECLGLDGFFGFLVVPSNHPAQGLVQKLVVEFARQGAEGFLLCRVFKLERYFKAMRTFRLNESEGSVAENQACPIKCFLAIDISIKKKAYFICILVQLESHGVEYTTYIQSGVLHYGVGQHKAYPSADGVSVTGVSMPPIKVTYPVHILVFPPGVYSTGMQPASLTLRVPVIETLPFGFI